MSESFTNTPPLKKITDPSMFYNDKAINAKKKN